MRISKMKYYNLTELSILAENLRNYESPLQLYVDELLIVRRENETLNLENIMEIKE